MRIAPSPLGRAKELLDPCRRDVELVADGLRDEALHRESDNSGLRLFRAAPAPPALLLDNFLLPHFGKAKLTAITRREVVRFVRALEATSAASRAATSTTS